MTPPAHPGALLRNKRIENGWSLADVAQALCLPVHRVEALENDDYRNLPGKTYILGYWRIYAGLLGVSIEDSLEAHKGSLPDTPADLSLKARRQSHRIDVEPPRHRLALLCVLLSVIFLVAVWYWQNPQPHPNPSNHQPVDAIGEMPEAATGITLPQGSLPEPNFSEGTLPPAEGAEIPPRFDARAAAATVAPVPPAAPAVDEAAPSAAESSPAHEEIVFAVVDDTWLEVRDDAGERLVYQMVESGQRLTLMGRPPFSVFVGNAAGVAVEYRGRQVPITPQANGTFARFQVGTR